MDLSTQNITDILYKTFPQLAEKELIEEISQVGKIMHFNAGEVIMNYGSYVRLVPLVIEGSVRVLREDDTEGKEILLYYINAGDTCSMSFTCCMMDKKSMIRTEAEEDVVLIGIPVRYMDQWMTKYQSWKNFIMMTYDAKMLELIKTIDTIAFKQLDERLMEYLHARKAATGSYSILSTHQQIADDLNVSREAVSRLLKKLENSGMIELKRNRIDIL
ncbi:MAG: Crp/Fnr family transcriptional regulator [Saprospiraceae bacterium]|nr:Crp/Fnr family transcriptional regulator [Saprospiraceae bacterium]